MLVMVTLRWPADLHLLHRLHGARRELHALLLLPLAVCGSDAGRGDREQPAAAVHVLGTGRPDVVSADRVLVSEAVGRGGGEESISHHARGRYLLSAWNCVAVRADGHAAVLQPRRGQHGAGRAGRAACGSCCTGTDARRRDWAADLRGRGGQERPASAACVAAGRDGRPDAGFRADSRGDDGGRGCVSDRACLSVDGGGYAAGRRRRLR